MTITIDNPWQLFGCVILAVAVLLLALSIFVMAMWSSDPMTRAVGFLAAAAGAASAVALVMAGGGWL